MKKIETETNWVRNCSRRFMVGMHISDYDQYPEISFHGKSLVPDILANIDPKAFVKDLKKAHVQAFWFYNKCHRGNCYYPSKVAGAHVHSALKGRDIFGEFTEACLSAGIVPLCIYEFLDHRIIHDKPEWCFRKPAMERGGITGEEHQYENTDDATVGRPSLFSPYGDFAINQAVETVKNYPIQGYFVDFIGLLEFGNWICPYANKVFKKDFGYDFPGINKMSHSEYVKYVKWHYKQYDIYTKKMLKAIHKVRPNLIFIHNAHSFGHMPNLQSWEMTAKNTSFFAGDLFFLSEGTLGISWMMRARAAASKMRPSVLLDSTHGSDRTSPKALDTHRAETWTARSLGVAVCSSIIMEHDGSYNPRCMALTKRIFAEEKKFESWFEDPELIEEIGIIRSQESDDFMPRKAPFPDMSLHALAFEGWCQAVIQGHHLWGIIHSFQITEEKIKNFKVIILPNVACLSTKQCQVITNFVKNGGKLIVTGESSLYNQNAEKRNNFGLNKLMGIKYKADWNKVLGQIILTHEVLLPEKPWESDLIQCKIGQLETSLQKGTVLWAEALAASERNLKAAVKIPGIAHRKVDAGEVIYFANEPGIQYRTQGQAAPLRVMNTVINQLKGDKSVMSVGAPPTVEIFAHHQKQKKRMIINLVNQVGGCSRNSTLVHTIHSSANINRGKYRRFEEIEEMPAVSNIVVKIRPDKKVKNIYLAPDQKELDYEISNNEIIVKVATLNVHAMIIIEYK